MKSVAIFSVCPEGTYGAGCSQNCTCNTLNTASCNSTTGACVCKAGWEGETCSDDVDECNTSPASLTVCPDHSVCTNTNGSFLCLCLKGFYKSQSLCLGKDKFVLTIYPVLLSLSSSSSSLVFALPLSYSSASKQSETKLTASSLKQVQSTKVSKEHLFVFNFLVTHWPPHPPHWITFPTVPFTRSIFPQSSSPDHFSHSPPHWISSHSQPHQITFPTVPPSPDLFPPSLLHPSPHSSLFPLPFSITFTKWRHVYMELNCTIQVAIDINKTYCWISCPNVYHADFTTPTIVAVMINCIRTTDII